MCNSSIWTISSISPIYLCGTHETVNVELTQSEKAPRHGILQKSGPNIVFINPENDQIIHDVIADKDIADLSVGDQVDFWGPVPKDN